MKRPFTCATLSALLLLVSVPSHAQSVDIGQLGAAQSYDAGPLGVNNDGLDPALWQGLSAERASAQIQAVNVTELSELPRRFMRRVLLSAGVPPQGDEASQTLYIQSSTNAKLRLDDYAALESLSDPQNPLQRDAKFRANLALASGDKEAACVQSDREIDNRAAPFWMQMRIVCHLIRDEAAAAELTLNLMRERDDKDEDFVANADYVLGLSKTVPDNSGVGSAVINALRSLDGDQKTPSSADYAVIALSDQASADERLEALFKTKNRLTQDQVKSIMSSLLFSDSDLAGGSSFDIDTALAGLQEAQSRTKSTAQLYNLALNYSDPSASAQAVATLLNFSESVDFVPQMTTLLSEAMAFIPSETQAGLDAQRFAWAALRRNDLSALGGIYRGLDSQDPLAGRIALASDALGNGFLLGQLGLDIETRLTQKGAIRKEAVRDGLIALALGAQLSDGAASAFEDYTKTERINPIGLARLNAAAKSSSRAQTLLYVIQAMGERESTELSGLEIYSYISALSQAGLTREAGELAAFDFLARVPRSE